jgi:hypothetical protein
VCSWRPGPLEPQKRPVVLVDSQGTSASANNWRKRASTWRRARALLRVAAMGLPSHQWGSELTRGHQAKVRLNLVSYLYRINPKVVFAEFT